MEYKIIREKRKTISIQITKEAEVLIKAPRHLSMPMIEEFINKKSEWIHRTRSRILDENRRKSAFDPLHEGSLLYLGKAYPIIESEKTAFDGTAFFVSEWDFASVRPGLIKLYRQLAKEYITFRVSEYAAVMRVIPTGVRITSANTRWGSCSGKNSLSFSWKLILADPIAIDYVVVHELAHIKQHNHSARFWAEIAEVLPDYRERKELLDRLQERLAGENWERETVTSCCNYKNNS